MRPIDETYPKAKPTNSPRSQRVKPMVAEGCHPMAADIAIIVCQTKVRCVRIGAISCRAR
jgi:hypothetical protein